MKMSYRASILVASIGLGLGIVSCTENSPQKDVKGSLDAPAQPAAQVRALPRDLLGKQDMFRTDRSIVQTSPNVQTDLNGFTAQAQEPVGVPDSLTTSAGISTGRPTPPEVPAPPVEPAMNIPKDAEWTLFCAMFTGPNGPAKAKGVKDALVGATGRRDFYIVQREVEIPIRVPVPGGLLGATKEEMRLFPETDIFYGFYKSIDRNTREGQFAQADRAFVANLTDADGEHPLNACIFMQLQPPDPVTPPEWNIVNKDANKPDSDPGKAFWSVEIAAYRGSPERKQKAVDCVKAARQMGIEAFYFHGKTTSSVCIGAWPRDAVKEGNVHSDDVRASPDEIVMYTNKPVRGGTSNTLVTPEGNKIRAFTQRADIQNESLRQTMQAYPHAVNGQDIRRAVTNTVTRKIEMESEPCFLIVIPRKAETGSRWSTSVAESQGGNAPAGPRNQHSLIESMQLPDSSGSRFQGTGATPVRSLKSVGE